MYKEKYFTTTEKIFLWLNEHKTITYKQVLNYYEGYVLIYWEEEPQPQQKDLIPESDKTESL